MSKHDQSQSEKEIKDDCLNKLRSILDGEASADEKKHFVEKHLDECMPCYRYYHLEMAIRNLLKSKCGNHEAPVELIESIRSKINSSH